MIVTTKPGSNTIVLLSKTFKELPNFDIDYDIKAKVFNQEGDLKYEYNPFRNLRDAETQELKDFRTEDLGFDLNHSVDIQVQPSYDGTVNLIINDDKSPPKLINSRFTVVEDKRYKVVDRKGNNDTNIYDNDEIEQVTRLFKTTENIPYINFEGLYEGGALKCGNYVFYFKYSDADGNESDIIAESGIISAYIGKINDPASIRGGMVNELTNKIAKLKISNLDTSYDYLNIYFTRSTSDYDETEITKAHKIITRKSLTNSNMVITITGLEDTKEIPLSELNVQYNIVDAVKSQTQVQNMLMFANVDKPTIPYKELTDLSLRIFPTVSNENNIGYLDHEYKPVELEDAIRKAEYYDATNVYKFTGYWNKEMYRIGVVYIMKDDTLSPVFDVRGRDNLGYFTRLGTFKNDISAMYSYTDLYDGQGKRQYIEQTDEGFIDGSEFELENTKGVVRLEYNHEVIDKDDKTGIYPLAIDFNIETVVLQEMKKHVKGFFFVRQKRIPTILCQGLSIGVDDLSHVPSIKAQVVGSNGQQQIGYIAEAFVDKSAQLAHDFVSRMIVTNSVTSPGGLLCPEAMLRSELFNEVFNSSLFNLSKAPFSPNSSYFKQDISKGRHFFINEYQNMGASDVLLEDIKLTLIEDSKPLRYSGSKYFSTRAGIPEEAWRFAFYNFETGDAGANNLIRGNFAGFVGAEGIGGSTDLYDIHVPGYNFGNMRDYFLLRANSFHPYYAISNRYDLKVLSGTLVPYEECKKQSDNLALTQYRGDCFINTFTVRMHRNFQDPEVPISDTILDPLTWKNNYKGYAASGGIDKENINKINRGDVNAVRIGHWATFKLCSNINLAYRATDDSQSAERALTGQRRSFFPLSTMSTRAENKIQESTVVNVGYNSTTSDKMYILQPDVPYIKNIFDNRIMFSEVHINDAFRNGYRVFDASAYKDITRQYGAITKIIDWNNNLMVVFENGVGMIPINEKMVAAQGDGSNAYIKSYGVLPDIINPLSTSFGSSWKESVIVTEGWVYGVDTIGKKIWRTNGQEFQIISDFKVQKFLNDKITLSESEKFPMISLRNVKTHYNAFKKDVMFTFYDLTRSNDEVKWNLCYNEQLENWITQYSWTPLASENINNVHFSFDREAAKSLALVGYSDKDNPVSEGIVLDGVSIGDLTDSYEVGTFGLKGYDYYKKYVQVFTLDPSLDAEYFTIQDNEGVYTLVSNGNLPAGKYVYNLKVRVGLNIAGEGLTEIQYFYDYMAVIVDRTILTPEQKTDFDNSISTWFWKHGQAGIFDITTPIKPTEWYGKQEKFEFEFVMVDNPNTHKIFDNLMIISNNAEPESFEFEVIGDVYDLPDTDYSYADAAGNYKSEIHDDSVKTYQKGLDMKTLGRMKGNMQYKEDMWNVEIKPIRFMEGSRLKETRLRDKHCKIRVRYSGTKLAVITALNTLYTQSYA